MAVTFFTLHCINTYTRHYFSLKKRNLTIQDIKIIRIRIHIMEIVTISIAFPYNIHRVFILLGDGNSYKNWIFLFVFKKICGGHFCCLVNLWHRAEPALVSLTERVSFQNRPCSHMNRPN